MLALVVCVPVPALALSGLSIPLPSVVERIAATLVPFESEPALEDGTVLVTGRIVSVGGEPAALAAVPRTPLRTITVRRTSTSRMVAWSVQPTPPRARTSSSPRTTPAPTPPAAAPDEPTAPETQPPARDPEPTPAEQPKPREKKDRKQTSPTLTPALDPAPASDAEPAPAETEETKPSPVDESPRDPRTRPKDATDSSLGG